MEPLSNGMVIREEGIGRNVTPLDVLKSFIVCWKIDHDFDDLFCICQIYNDTPCPHQPVMESDVIGLGLVVGAQC